MKKQLLLIWVVLIGISCKKPIIRSSTDSRHKTNKSSFKPKPAELIVSTSLQYIGTPYKYSGTTKAGMDCSGLVFVVFKELGKSIPRISSEQAYFFKEIKKDEVSSGDIVYFRVNSKNIDHTGIIVEVKDDKDLMFIHSSTSQGVRIDNLSSKYWSSKVVKFCRPQL